MKSDITVQGSVVIYHADQHRPFETKVDFTPHLKLITSTMGDLISKGKPRMICIEGLSGSGKSGLAKLLKNDGVNVTLIDVCAMRNHYVSGPTDISGLFTDKCLTYVIDELGFADKSCYPIIESHLDQGGTVVALVQSQLDISLDAEIAWLKMDRNGIEAV